MNSIQADEKGFSFSFRRYLKKLGQRFQSGSINARTLLHMSPCWRSPFKWDFRKNRPFFHLSKFYQINPAKIEFLAKNQRHIYKGEVEKIKVNKIP